MAKQRTRWTAEQKVEFGQWHAQLLKERGYPEEIVKELTRTCQRWLVSVPLVKEEK